MMQILLQDAQVFSPFLSKKILQVNRERHKKKPSMTSLVACRFSGIRPTISATGTSHEWVSPRLVKVQKYPTGSKFSSIKSVAAGNGVYYERSHGIDGSDAVIIVDHGSRRKESNLMLDEFVAMFRDKTCYPIVEPAHMELAEPSIRDAFGACIHQGATRVIVSPFFLFPGRHWHKDIPSLTAEAAKQHPGVPYIITAPLGLHELLVDVVTDRIKHCLSHVAGDADECTVCAGTGKCQLYSH